MDKKVYFNGIEMPTPASIEYSNNKLWSQNTGRSTATGLNVGDIITIKKKLVISWTWLTGEQTELLNSFISNVNIPSFTVDIIDEAFVRHSYVMYAGTPIYKQYSWNEKFQLVQSLNVDLIEQ